MNIQLLKALLNDLCMIAGSNRGAADLEGCLFAVLKHLAGPDESKLPEGQGEDILEFLKLEIVERRNHSEGHRNLRRTMPRALGFTP
jgi:hypothetical protein